MKSEAPRPKLHLIATGLALVAVACALAAVIVVVTRSRDERIERLRAATPPDVVSMMVVIDAHTKASTAKQLRQRRSVVLVDGGVTVNDPALASALGLAPGDVITSVSGHPLSSESAVHKAWLWLDLGATLYLEIVRDKRPMILRMHLEDDLSADTPP